MSDYIYTGVFGVTEPERRKEQRKEQHRQQIVGLLGALVDELRALRTVHERLHADLQEVKDAVVYAPGGPVAEAARQSFEATSQARE